MCIVWQWMYYLHIKLAHLNNNIKVEADHDMGVREQKSNIAMPAIKDTGETFNYKNKDLKKNVEPVHKEKKSHDCLLCDYSSSYKKDIKKHTEAVHEGKKPYKCEICDYKSSKKDHLNRHIEAVHEGKKPYHSGCLI